MTQTPPARDRTMRLFNWGTTLLLFVLLLAIIGIALAIDFEWFSERMGDTAWRSEAPIFGASAFVSSLVLVGAVRWFTLRRKLLDIPNQRSSHTLPTPRGGGVVIAVVSIVLTILWLAGDQAAASPDTGAFLGIAAALSLLGLSDDWVGEIPPKPRLMLQAFAVATLIILVASNTDLQIALPIRGITFSGVLAAGVLFAWGVSFTNAFNFMDGIDGIAGLQACFAFTGWAVLLWIEGQFSWALFALIVASACLGFLAHNLAPARIFMGDAGSLFLGFSLAMLPLMAYAAAHNPHLFITGGLFVYPFAVDAAYTLFRRWRRGENLLSAHRSHLYQRLTIGGWSHGAVTRLYGVLMAISVGLALVYYGGGEATRLVTLIAALVFAGACITGGERLIAKQR